jgi:hypothetical protein
LTPDLSDVGNALSSLTERWPQLFSPFLARSVERRFFRFRFIKRIVDRSSQFTEKGTTMASRAKKKKASAQKRKRTPSRGKRTTKKAVGRKRPRSVPRSKRSKKKKQTSPKRVSTPSVATIVRTMFGGPIKISGHGTDLQRSIGTQIHYGAEVTIQNNSDQDITIVGFKSSDEAVPQAMHYRAFPSEGCIFFMTYTELGIRGDPSGWAATLSWQQVPGSDKYLLG